jgi:hypothetical protein
VPMLNPSLGAALTHNALLMSSSLRKSVPMLSALPNIQLAA